MSAISNVIAARHVRIAEPVPASRPAEESTTDPRITLIKEGNTVKAIRVTCSCGEVIQMDCRY